MSRFEEKRELRKARYEELAEKNAKIAEVNSFSNVLGEENTGIPFGQPILVGHHSEKRHRRHLERLHNKIEKGIEAGDKANYYTEKAAHIDDDRNIYSDDPEAIIKLEEKIKKLEDRQNKMKLANKIIFSKKLEQTEKVSQLVALLGVKEETAQNFIQPDERGRVEGFAHYSLSNNNANIRTAKKRLEQLKAIKSKEPINFKVGEIEVIEDDCQLQVHFPFKPSEEVRGKLKSYPFSLKWSSYSKAWVRKITASVGPRYAANLKSFLETINQQEEGA